MKTDAQAVTGIDQDNPPEMEQGSPEVWVGETATLAPGQGRVKQIDISTHSKMKDRFKLKSMYAFLFEYYSAVDKKIYTGEVVAKRLSIGEMARMETEIARRNAGIDNEGAVAEFNRSLCNIKYMVVDGPTWLLTLEDNDEIHDLILARRLWEKLMEFDSSFR